MASVRGLIDKFEKASNTEIYDQIVVGSGSSALNFLHSAFEGNSPYHAFNKKKTLVIGEGDLWSKIDPEHRIGQPPHLIKAFPTVTNPSDVGQLTPSDPSNPNQAFLTAGGIVAHNNALRGQVISERNQTGQSIRFCPDAVINVQKSGFVYLVKTRKNGVFQAREMIIASGIGPPSTLPKIGVTIEGAGNHQTRRPYPEIVEAVAYLNSAPPRGLLVLIFGGSATAAWAAAHAALNGADFIWMCRQGYDQITTEGNPVGRNTSVINLAHREGRIGQGIIKKIQVLDAPEPNQPGLYVEMEGQQPASSAPKYIRRQKLLERELRQKNKPEKDIREELEKSLKKNLGENPFVRDPKGMVPWKTQHLFHQVVYAIGSDPQAPGGPAAILDRKIFNRLEPVWDKDYRFGLEKRESVIAFATPDKTCWVVGATVFGFEKLKRGAPNTTYQSMAELMPHATRPPEGIPLLTHAIARLTGHTQLGSKINLSKATPNELFREFKSYFKPNVPDQFVNALVYDFQELRRDSKFGLKPAEITEFLENFFDAYEGLRDFVK